MSEAHLRLIVGGGRDEGLFAVLVSAMPTVDVDRTVLWLMRVRAWGRTTYLPTYFTSSVSVTLID